MRHVALASSLLVLAVAGLAGAQTRRDIGVGPAPTYQGRALYGNSWAVVIGVDRYQKPELRLHYARRPLQRPWVPLRDGRLLIVAGYEATGEREGAG